jgi:hypothetical protein
MKCDCGKFGNQDEWRTYQHRDCCIREDGELREPGHDARRAQDTEESFDICARLRGKWTPFTPLSLSCDRNPGKQLLNLTLHPVG